MLIEYVLKCVLKLVCLPSGIVDWPPFLIAVSEAHPGPAYTKEGPYIPQASHNHTFHSLAG